MAVSVDYFARETASNLWRNRLMTIAAILTVAVSLSLVGTAFLVRVGVANATTQWQRGVNVLVWLNPGLPATQQTSIHNQLVRQPFVKSCVYRSQTYDYAEARHLLPPDEAQVLTADTTPASYRCALQDPKQAQAIIQEFKGRPGINGVNAPTQAIHSMENWTRILQLVSFSIASILALSAIVLVLNTIRLAIFARRREVSVMKLVGATNWFIRVPFMFEGLVQGVLGALIAALVVAGLHWLVDAVANHSSYWAQFRVTGSQVLVTNALVVIFGLLVGTVGSYFAIRRFLDA
ncbi:MAG: cell division protein FtsX [Acidimicrobiales bacterium]